jgi:hypothetical protein
MSNLEAKLASAFLVTAAIGLGGLASGLPDYGATAADGCLTEPRGATPQGKHWYYRIQQGTGRQCWYLRGEGEQTARAVPSAKPVARRQDLATTRSIADARAEINPRTHVADDTAPSVWPNPSVAASPAAAADTNAAGSPPASRWPQSSDAAPGNMGAAPANQAPEASLMVADADPVTDASQQQQPTVPPPPMAAAPERNTGSLQKLFLVAGGALALAGLTGSAVFRLARRRRRNDWLRERSNWQSEGNPRNPPWIEPVLAQPRTELADLDETHEVVPQSDFAEVDFAEPIDKTEDADEPVENIEEFLARLTARLHQELDGTRSERDVHAS